MRKCKKSWQADYANSVRNLLYGMEIVGSSPTMTKKIKPDNDRRGSSWAMKLFMVMLKTLQAHGHIWRNTNDVIF